MTFWKWTNKKGTPNEIYKKNRKHLLLRLRLKCEAQILSARPADRHCMLKYLINQNEYWLRWSIGRGTGRAKCVIRMQQYILMHFLTPSFAFLPKSHKSKCSLTEDPKCVASLIMTSLLGGFPSTCFMCTFNLHIKKKPEWKQWKFLKM